MDKNCKTCRGTGFSEEYCDGYVSGRMTKCKDCSPNLNNTKEVKDGTK